MSIWFYLSAGVLVLGCVGAVLLQRNTTHRKGRSSVQILTPFRVVAAAIAIAIYILTLPTVTGTGDNPMSVSNRIFGALYLTFQVFIASLDIRGILDVFRTSTDICTQAQAAYTVILFAIAPLMAIGFLLTFLQTFSAYIRYLFHPLREVNVFSELNERSIALATSIRNENRSQQTKKTDLIIFTEVILANNEPSMELIGQARRLGALCFKHDISSLPLKLHAKKSLIRFFLMGSDEERNLEYAVSIINSSFNTRGNTDLYLFSSTVESELALRYRPGGVRVRRIDSTRELVYNWLWRTQTTLNDKEKQPAGVDLFNNAIRTQNGDKTISAVILGLGGYGLEMLKALSWYCQMDDQTDDAVSSYQLIINAYDKDLAAEDRFAEEYPELTKKLAIEHPRQDAVYDIAVHGGVDAASPFLFRQLEKLNAITFVFISLGDDGLNLEVATKVRTWLAREKQARYWEGTNPQILVVSHHSQPIQTAVQTSVKAMLTKAARQVRMDLIGDISEMYSYDTVIRALMEHNGLVSHMQWAELVGQAWSEQEASFWNDAYNYNSSIATPIHWRARRMLNIPGIDRRARTKDQQEFLSRLEHARWNAFLRSEGFIYEDGHTTGVLKDTSVAKTHNLLVPFGPVENPNQPCLPESEQRKDRNDASDALAYITKKLAYTYTGFDFTKNTTEEDMDAELAKHPEIPMDRGSVQVANYIETELKTRPKTPTTRDPHQPSTTDLLHVAQFVKRSAAWVQQNLDSIE